MEEKLIKELKKIKVREMSNPVILMNDKDFEEMENDLFLKIDEIGLGEHPFFSGIPIKTNSALGRGCIFVADEIKSGFKHFQNKYNDKHRKGDDRFCDFSGFFIDDTYNFIEKQKLNISLKSEDKSQRIEKLEKELNEMTTEFLNLSPHQKEYNFLKNEIEVVVKVLEALKK